jgi:hypothetical protein
MKRHPQVHGRVVSGTTTSTTTTSAPALNLQSLGSDDFLNLILSYLNAKELSMVDACCSKETQRASALAWNRLSRKVQGATQLLEARYSAKQRSILEFRAARFAERMEHQSTHEPFYRTNRNSDKSCCVLCPECGLLPNIETETFREPEAFDFFVRLSSASLNHHGPRVVLWQGFVPTFGRRSCRGLSETSTVICYSNLEALSSDIGWSSAMREKLGFEHQKHGSVEGPDFMKWVRRALGSLSVTVVAFRKEILHSPPNLVVSGNGLHSVSRSSDRLCYNLQSKHCYALAEGKESWVSPRLITRESPTAEKPGQLLGIRLELKGLI